MPANDVKNNAGELRCILAEMDEKIDFVLAKMNEYSKVLKKVQTAGVKDQLIRKKIGEVNNELKNERMQLYFIKQEIDRTVARYNEGIKDIDKESFMDFVRSELATVNALVGRIQGGG